MRSAYNDVVHALESGNLPSQQEALISSYNFSLDQAIKTFDLFQKGRLAPEEVLIFINHPFTAAPVYEDDFFDYFHNTLPEIMGACGVSLNEELVNIAMAIGSFDIKKSPENNNKVIEAFNALKAKIESAIQSKLPELDHDALMQEIEFVFIDRIIELFQRSFPIEEL